MQRKLILLLITTILIASCTIAAELNRNGITFQWDYSHLQPDDYDEAKVIKNVDGDTLTVTLDGWSETIRMIGVDTPETVHPSKPVEVFGKEASNFTKAMCPVGATVYLTYDWDPRDKYNRLLAYIWYKVGNTWVLHNLNLIANGYGNAYTSYAFREDYMVTFRNAEAYARVNGLGLWGESEETAQVNPETYREQNNRIKTSDASVIISNVEYRGSDEYVELKNTGRTPVSLDGWRILSVRGEQVYHLSDFILQPGGTISIHSGKDAIEIVWTYAYIHNNRGDAVSVFDSSGDLVDYFGWGEYQ